MRVIAGENKGRTLKTVASRMTRPTTDKVKETIFNMIGPFFSGGEVLDLYAGSGGLGIEALSRGAGRAVFVDKAGAACAVIRENLSRCRYEERSDVIRQDVQHALSLLAGQNRRFDYVFIDPPYARQHLVKDIETLLNRHFLSDGAIVVVEHEDTVELPEYFGNQLSKWKFHTYHGKTAVSIYVLKK